MIDFQLTPKSFWIPNCIDHPEQFYYRQHHKALFDSLADDVRKEDNGNIIPISHHHTTLLAY